MATKHHHADVHRGVIPESQLASGTPGSGKLPVGSGTGEAAWTTVGYVSDHGLVTYFDFVVGSAPANPSAGRLRIYALTGGHLYQLTSGGVATALDGAGGGSVPEIVGVGDGQLDFSTTWTAIFSPNSGTGGGGPGAYAFYDDGPEPAIRFFADHATGDRLFAGMIFAPGTDERLVILSEKSASVTQFHMADSNDHNVEISDDPSSNGGLSTGRWVFVDDGDNKSYPTLGMARQFSSAPTAQFEGEHYYDTTTHKEYVWNGSSWNALW